MQFEPTDLKDLLHLREEYLSEVNCQIIHDSHHARGFTQLYAIKGDRDYEKAILGYGAIGDYDNRKTDIIKEFHVRPEHRRASLKIFQEFIKTTKATRVGSQTNDVQLTLLLYDTCEDIRAEGILFADSGQETKLSVRGATFRKLTDAEKQDPFDHKAEPVGEWGIEYEREIVATGGWLTHYNKPYADLYMEVNEKHRKRGFGGYLIQELRREVKSIGMKSAARTGKDNLASRRTLEKGGMLVCARSILGTVQ